MTSLLGDNLREIYIAAHDEAVQEIPLVANLSGTHLYYTSTGWGRLWRWFYNVIDFLFRTDLATEKLRKGIEKTQKIFIEQLNKTIPALEKYSEYFYKRSADVPVNEKEYDLARKKISNWNIATAPFIELMETNKKIRVLFSKLYQEFTKKETSSSLISLPIFQHLIDLEGYLHKPLPINLFNQLSMGTSLKEKEMKAIKEWIDEHNKKSSPLAVRPFHLALKALALLKGSEGASLNQLEWALIELGIKVFFQRDPEHIKWRSQLKPGSVLNYEDQVLILGKQMGKKKSEDANLVFEVQNEPDLVVVIGINQAILDIKEKLNQELSWGVHPAELVGISFKGDFALYRRLHQSLESHQWESKNGKISQSDKDIITPISQLLQWMIKKELSPKTLHSKHILFDQSGRLAYGKTCLPMEFNYTVLEDFVFELSNGNRTIFCTLMEKSGLYTHRYKNFYLTIVTKALLDEPLDIPTLAALDNVPDPRVEDRGKELYQEVIQVKEKCKNEYLEDHYTEVPALILMINMEFLQTYERMKLCGRLWPNMEKEIKIKL